MITSPNWAEAALDGGKLGVVPVYLQFPGKPGCIWPVARRSATPPTASRGRHPLAGARVCVLKTQVDRERKKWGVALHTGQSQVGVALLKCIQASLKLWFQGPSGCP